MEAVNNNLSKIQTLLRYTFGLVPIIAGLDKFTNLLTDWAAYLNPLVTNIIPISAHTFMLIVGIVEIIAGIIVLSKPEVGAFIVAAWLLLIALNLITSGKYLDVAVRDLVMAISAFVLGRLTLTLKNTSESVQNKGAARNKEEYSYTK
jgi:hypothetical protein